MKTAKAMKLLSGIVTAAMLFWGTAGNIQAASKGGRASRGGSGGQRGRSGVVDRNRDPRGPHTGRRHQNGQVDQGWHGGGGGKKDKGESNGRRSGRFREKSNERVGGWPDRSRDGQRGKDRDFRRDKRCNYRDHGRKEGWKKKNKFRDRVRDRKPGKRRGGKGFRNRQAKFGKLKERWKKLSPEKRQAVMGKLKERWKNLSPEKRSALRRKLRECFGRGSGDRKHGNRNQPDRNRPPPRIEDDDNGGGGKAKRDHWDRGLHRGQREDDPRGGKGGGYGKDREKWDDYEDKPGNGNENPGGKSACKDGPLELQTRRPPPPANGGGV